MQRIPARPGDLLAEIDTPALVVDLDAFERNLDLMAAVVRGSGLALRPHAKSHKCPEVALAQVGLGAIGICCQKVDEAAAFVAAGIRDVLVTNEIVEPRKLARLAELARSATIGVLVDDARAVPLLSAAAVAAVVTLQVYVEIDVGAQRCGVPPGASAVALALAIAGAPGLALRGLHAYQGAAQHLRLPAERRVAIEYASRVAAETRDLLLASGLPCPVITGAGTGTWHLERDSTVYTELQPGSYIFMDADYGRNALGSDEHAFEQSLYVLAAVMSVPAPDRAIVDAGLKALAFDSGLPLVHAAHGLEYVKASDEHGVLRVDPALAAPALGDQVWLVPGHCDPTVNLYDWIVAARGNTVEAVWPVSARGALN